jgi:hypothetical protein
MNRSGLRAALLAACLVIGVLSAIFTSGTPAPRPADAPAEVFSAARAMADDRIIAATPHPEGSPAARAARDYIFGRMQALGLSPRRAVGEAMEVFPPARGRFAVGGAVENLIGVLPGADPSAPAILLMAHSDSVPGSPGAADDGAGVVSTLETLRALKAAGPHKRDVIVLITDGEEAGLLGARAFLASGDPLLRHIGMIVNMEARGGGGRVAMFETGADNGAAIRFFAHAVNNTDALSLMSQVYKYLPNSTDFTVSKAAGYPGYNFAFLGEEFDYHSPSSTPAALDQGSVQHMGDQVLALTKALADAPALPARSPDAIYSDVLGGPVIAYSAAAGWGLLALCGVLTVLGAFVGARRGGEALRPGGVARGLGAALLSMLAAVLVLNVAWRLIGLGGDVVQARKLLAQFNGLFAGCAFLALGVLGGVWSAAFSGSRRWVFVGVALAVGVLSCLAGLDLFGLGLAAVLAVLAAGVLGRPLAPWSGWLGTLLLGLLLTLALQILSPPLTVAIAWPLLIGAAAMALIALLGAGRFDSAAGVVIALVAGVVTAAHLGHLATPIFIAVGVLAPEGLAILPFLALFALYPLLCRRETRAGRLTSAVLVLAGIGTLAVVALRDPASSRTPRPVQAFYLDDAVGGRDWIATTLNRLDPWSKAALSSGGVIERRDVSPQLGHAWLSPAPLTVLPRPAFSQTVQGSAGNQAVTLIIAPHEGGRDLRLYLQPTAPITGVTLNGHATELAPKPGQWAQLRWEAPSGPLTLRFIAKGPGALDLRYEAITDGLPAAVALPPKPADAMLWGLSDKTVLLDRYTARW